MSRGNVKGWTFDAYDKYMDRRFQDNGKAVDAALAAAKEAVLKAEKATGDRLAGLNEFRGLVTDQQATFATKEAFEALSARLRRVEDSEVLRGGKALGSAALISYVVGALGALSIIFSIIKPFVGV